MKKLRVVVSLITQDDDFQMEQAAAAEAASANVGVQVHVVFADNDSIQQSQQLLNFVQAAPEERPDGIIFEPVGATALPQVARAAVAANIGWVVMNKDVEYIRDLRRGYKAPCFSIASDHQEIGRIQGRQLAALLPDGGTVLYIQGPAETDASKLRTAGMYETKAENIHIKAMKGNWTEASAFKAVNSWLRLSTSQQSHIDLVAAQNDAMAAGARKALQQFSREADGRNHWVTVPFIGVDGVPKTGQAWVRSGVLAATIIAPPIAGSAIEMLAHALQTAVMPPELTLVPPRSYPEMDALAASARKTSSAKSGSL